MQELLKSVRSLSQKERKALAALLKRQGVNLYGITPVLKRSPEEPLQLSYAQQRQWFLWQLEPGSAAYHIPAVLCLHGELDTEALKRSFAALVERHEVLRTTFRQEGEDELPFNNVASPHWWSVMRYCAPPSARKATRHCRSYMTTCLWSCAKRP
ncbi:hypothetical protein Q093_06280 [Pseudomonas aeruginosa CF614]|nr:hypothetical protein Q093_06280 [Pseudomonas aeruginosa CF614]